MRKIEPTGQFRRDYKREAMRLQNVSVKASDKGTKGQALGEVDTGVNNDPQLLRFNIAVSGAKTDLLEVLPK